ncbi:hypothetical protein PRIEUP_LOCUS747 [Pristimantis euphronides]
MMELFILYFLTAVLYGKCLLGLKLNMIIVIATFMKWRSLKCLQAVDKILSSLAITRGLFFITIFSWNCFFQFFPWLLKMNSLVSILSIQIVFTFFSTHWIAAILCVFYCVKIVTYNYKLFVFLKPRISTIIPRLIMASLVLSLILSLRFGFYGDDLKIQNVLNGSTENITEYGLVPVPNFDEEFLIFVVGSTPPFLIFCVANFLLIHFLLIHTKRMGINGSQSQSPNLDSHFRALKSMTLFLLLQIILVLCMSLSIFGRYFHLQYLPLIEHMLLCSSPFFHSLYIVSSSSDIRKISILRSLGIFKCF